MALISIHVEEGTNPLSLTPWLLLRNVILAERLSPPPSGLFSHDCAFTVGTEALVNRTSALKVTIVKRIISRQRYRALIFIGGSFVGWDNICSRARIWDLDVNKI